MGTILSLKGDSRTQFLFTGNFLISNADFSTKLVGLRNISEEFFGRNLIHEIQFTEKSQSDGMTSVRRKYSDYRGKSISFKAKIPSESYAVCRNLS